MSRTSPTYLPQTTLSPMSQEDGHVYPTVKKSASAARPSVPRNRSTPVPSIMPFSWRDDVQTRGDSPKPVKLSQSVDGPATLSTAGLERAALRRLPTPLLILSQQKRVILANNAMHALLAAGALIQRQDVLNDYGSEGSVALDILCGLSLPQMGIQIDEQQGWFSCEVGVTLPWEYAEGLIRCRIYLIGWNMM